MLHPGPASVRPGRPPFPGRHRPPSPAGVAGRRAPAPARPACGRGPDRTAAAGSGAEPAQPATSTAAVRRRHVQRRPGGQQPQGGLGAGRVGRPDPQRRRRRAVRHAVRDPARRHHPQRPGPDRSARRRGPHRAAGPHGDSVQRVARSVRRGERDRRVRWHPPDVHAAGRVRTGGTGPRPAGRRRVRGLDQRGVRRPASRRGRARAPPRRPRRPPDRSRRPRGGTPRRARPRPAAGSPAARRRGRRSGGAARPPAGTRARRRPGRAPRPGPAAPACGTSGDPSSGPSGRADTRPDEAGRGTRPASPSAVRSAASRVSTRCRYPRATSQVPPPGTASSTPACASGSGPGAAPASTVVPTSRGPDGAAAASSQIAQVGARCCRGSAATAPGTAAAAVRGAVARAASSTGTGPPGRAGTPAAPRAPAVRRRRWRRDEPVGVVSDRVQRARRAADDEVLRRHSGFGLRLPMASAPASPSTPSSTPAPTARRWARTCSCNGTGSPRTSAASSRRSPKR